MEENIIHIYENIFYYYEYKNFNDKDMTAKLKLKSSYLPNNELNEFIKNNTEILHTNQYIDYGNIYYQHLFHDNFYQILKKLADDNDIISNLLLVELLNEVLFMKGTDIENNNVDFLLLDKYIKKLCKNLLNFNKNNKKKIFELLYNKVGDKIYNMIKNEFRYQKLKNKIKNIDLKREFNDEYIDDLEKLFNCNI